MSLTPRVELYTSEHAFWVVGLCHHCDGIDVDGCEPDSCLYDRLKMRSIDTRAPRPKAMNFGGITFMTLDMERRASAPSYIAVGAAAWRHVGRKSNVSFDHDYLPVLRFGPGVQGVQAILA